MARDMNTNYGAGEEFIDWDNCYRILDEGDRLVRELRRIDDTAERARKIREYLDKHSASLGNRPMTITRRQLSMRSDSLDKVEAARRLQTLIKQSRVFVNSRRGKK